MDNLIPENMRAYFKDIEQKAVDYALSKVRSSEMIQTKIEELKHLERVVTALVIVMIALLVFLTLKTLSS